MISGQTCDRSRLGIDGINRSLKMIAHQGINNAIANARRIARGTNDGDSTRLKKGPERSGGGDAVADFGPAYASLAGSDGQIDLQVAAFQFLAQLEARFAEDFDHALVICMGHGPK